jgi:hypothetical protein
VVVDLLCLIFAGTLLVSLGVIFGPTLRAMLEAALFIFFVKPFVSPSIDLARGCVLNLVLVLLLLCLCLCRTLATA